MGTPSACDECGKKFKVFTAKKKCKHCRDVVCKSCYEAHMELKHTTIGRRGRPGRRRRESLAAFDTDGAPDQEDLQFLSPIAANSGLAPGFGFHDAALDMDTLSPDVLAGMDDVEAVSEDDDEDEDDEDDELDDREGEGEGDVDGDEEDEDELLLALSRRSSIEEEETQFREFQQIQSAVAVWALKDKQACQRLRRRLDEGRATQPDGWDDCEFQSCSAFALGYAVATTLVVWALFAAAYVAFMQARGALAMPLTYVF